MITLPGIFILLFFIAALLVKRYRGFFLLSAGVFYLLSTYYVGNKLVSALERPYNKPLEEIRVDGIVVLGGGHYKGSSNLPLTESSFKRFIYAVMIAKTYNLPLIYAGANYEIIATKMTVTELNKSLDLNLTTPKDGKIDPYFSILYTHNSVNTRQNAQEAYALFNKHNITKPKIYLVTSALHMQRAKNLFTSYGFDVIPAATDFKSRSDSCYCFYYPTESGMKLNNLAIHEILGNLRDSFIRTFQ